MNCGRVFLVGAGPGDYKLISLKGLEYVQIAEVIVYDRLVDERLLRFARREAELVFVGKAAGAHSRRQEDINQLLVERALAGRIVVRLKGGDPFVFGRGGEEALALAEAGVPFEVVPGITSAVAVPAYAGIPVTHRGLAASLTVVTGHEDPDKGESGIRWDKLSGGADTLVFLMGMENLSQITARLIENGRPSDTPAAVVRWGTRSCQEVLVTTIGRAAADAAARQLTPPAVFIVGEVVTLQDRLAWFDTKPLAGQTVLVTRARDQAGLLINALEALGAECCEAPAITILPPESFTSLDAAINRLSIYQWLIFTSANGVDWFFDRLQTLGGDARALSGLKVAAIGVPTADRLRSFGIVADIVPVEFRAEGIVAALAGKVDSDARVLIPRAAVARDVLPEKLREMGAAVEVVPVYRTAVGSADGSALAARLTAGAIDLVSFTSSSTVTNLIALLGPDGPELLRSVRVACIGPITAATCLEYGINPAVIAEEYTIAGLVKAIRKLYEEGLT